MRFNPTYNGGGKYPSSVIFALNGTVGIRDVEGLNDDEQYFSDFANNFDFTKINDIDLWNLQIDNYNSLLTNTGYSTSNNKAVKYDGVNDYQKWFNSIGGHDGDWWKWSAGRGITTDKYNEDGFTGDDYFGHLTYRRRVNYFTPEEAEKINEKLLAAGKNFKFVLEDANGGNGRQGWKLVSLDDTESKEIDTEGLPTETTDKLTGDYTGDYSKWQIPKYEGSQSRPNTYYTGWFPHLMNRFADIRQNRAVYDQATKLRVPVYEAPYLESLVRDDYFTLQALKNREADLIAQGMEVSNLSSDLRHNNKIFQNVLSLINELDEKAYAANKQAIDTSAQLVVNTANQNRLLANNVANTNRQNLDAGANALEKAKSDYILRDSESRRNTFNNNRTDYNKWKLVLQLNYDYELKQNAYADLLQKWADNKKRFEADFDNLKQGDLSGYENNNDVIRAYNTLYNTIKSKIHSDFELYITSDEGRADGIDTERQYIEDVLGLKNFEGWDDPRLLEYARENTDFAPIVADYDGVMRTAAKKSYLDRQKNAELNYTRHMASIPIQYSSEQYDPFWRTMRSRRVVPTIRLAASGAKIETYEDANLKRAKAEALLKKLFIQSLENYTKERRLQDVEAAKTFKMTINKLTKEEEILLRAIFK